MAFGLYILFLLVLPLEDTLVWESSAFGGITLAKVLTPAVAVLLAFEYVMGIPHRSSRNRNLRSIDIGFLCS